MHRPAGYSDEEDDEDDEWMYGGYWDDGPPSRGNIDFAPKPETDEVIFHTAITDGNLEKIKNMLFSNFNVDEPLLGGWSGLLHACSLGSVSVVRLLIEAKADVNFNKENFTPLMALCKCSSTDEEALSQCLDMLLQNGANVNATDRNACTALMYACDAGHLPLVKTLVDLKCDVNIQDIEGWSALFHAVHGGREDISRVLIEGNARVDLIDKRKRSAYDLAMLKGFEHLAELVCSKKERRKLDQNDTLPIPGKVSSDPVQDLLQELPRTNCKFVSGYSSDVSQMLWAMGMGHYSAIFYQNSVQLNELLLTSDDKLKQIGVRFSIHRQTILNSIRKFHLHRWNKATIGMKPRNQHMDLEDGIKVVANITKHLHILAASINYIKSYQTLPMEPNVFNSSESALHQLSLINSELKAICSFASKLKKREKLEPVDLIKPKQYSKSYIFPLLTTIVLVSIILWKENVS